MDPDACCVPDAPHPEAPLHALLLRHFGHDAFRPGQERLIRAVLRGRDALGVLPTGGGKSVTFQLPALVLPGLVLVVSPLISLMEDQVRRAREAGIAAAYLNSTLPPARRRRVVDEARAGALRLLFVAPERFRVPRFLDALRRLRVSLLAIDEAHCISEWGHDFRPDYLRLGAVRTAVDAPVLALTATATPRVRNEIRSVLRLRAPVEVVGTFDRPNLSWHVLRADGHARKVAAVRALLPGPGGWGRVAAGGRGAGERRAGSAIVYGPTRRAVEALRRELAARGLPVEAYHAGLPAGDRARIQEAFMSGRRPVVVATNAFGMGVDKADVRLVVHYQLPGSLESYYQEAGRGGRDGEPARCVALHGPADVRLHRGFVDRGHPPPRRLRRLHRALTELVGPGRRATLDLDDLARRLRAPRGREEVEAGLDALARVGAVRLYPLRGPEGASTRTPREATGTAPGGTRTASSGSQRMVAGLHAGAPDLAACERLRAAALARLRAVERYARARGCRRRTLLAYFGEDARGRRCDGCDRCLGADDPVRGRLHFSRPPRTG